MATSEDYTYDIIKIKDFLTNTKERKKTKEKNNDEEDLQSIFCKNRLIQFINPKYQSFKKTVRNLKESIQKILTLTDVGTDIRTCYIMYDINPYWYTIMLSAIVTPFIVFWASSYNFKFVVKLRECADSDSKCSNKVLSIWVTALSLPIIGIILTIIEILGLYLLGLMKRCIPIFIADERKKETCKYKIIKFLQKKQEIIINHHIIKFWNWCLEEFNNGSREFFQICELFFESIPQVILQLWIYMFHSESFTDSSGKPLLTTFDISLSLGAATLNIIINGYEIKNKARAWGLSLSSYIPYFMGSQLNIVKDSCIPVKNWLNTNRYCCDLSHIERFFASKMIKQSNVELSGYIEHLKKFTTLESPKKIILPLKTNETIDNIYEADIKRTELIKFLTTLRKAQDDGIIAIDINEFGHINDKYENQIFLISKVIIAENRLNWDFLKKTYRCDYSNWFSNIPIINKLIGCRYKNRYKVPLIENFIDDISAKSKLSSKLFIIGWARRYLNYIECYPCCDSEAEIYDELHQDSKLMWSGIKKIRNKNNLQEFNKVCFGCRNRLHCKKKTNEVANNEYFNNIFKKIEERSLEKPLFYNYIQYISMITMLFNPEYFYMYQSITTQFYIILSIYGDKRIIGKIYKSINYLLFSDDCPFDEYLFSKFSYEKWRTLVYMNKELLTKCLRYLELISEYDHFSDYYERSHGGPNYQDHNDYLTKIIFHSLVKTLDITTCKKFKLQEYDREPENRDSVLVLQIPKYTDQERNTDGDEFKMILLIHFDLEQMYYYITGCKLIKNNYKKVFDSYNSGGYLSLNETNKNKYGLPKLYYEEKITNSNKFIFVKKEQSEISINKYEDPDSNNNEYYILTDCRKYFLNFKINYLPTYGWNERTGKEIQVKPYLISRKGYIGKSPNNSVVRVIDSTFKLSHKYETEPHCNETDDSLNVEESEIVCDSDETKVNADINAEDDTKESVKIDVKE